MRRINALLFILGIVLLACSVSIDWGDQPQEMERNQFPTTIIPTESSSINTIPTEEASLNIPEAEYITTRRVYTPIHNCAPSRLKVGDYVYVSYGGRPNAIRNTPDVHPSDNIIYRAPQGEGMKVVGGPMCSWGWILWEVDTDSGFRGWTPESNGKEFWLVPIDPPRDPPSEITNNKTLYAAYQDVKQVMSDKSLSFAQRQDQIRVLQRSYGEEVITAVIRWVPVYDPERDTFVSFDSYMRNFISQYGVSSPTAPIEQDPVGAAMSIYFNPSVENITQILGLDGLSP